MVVVGAKWSRTSFYRRHFSSSSFSLRLRRIFAARPLTKKANLFVSLIVLSIRVYGLVEARSGARSNCSLWTSFFAANGVVRSPVGSTPAVGFDAIQKHCDAWNQLLGPQGNGWYPMELWSSDNEVKRSSISPHLRSPSSSHHRPPSS